MGEGFWGRKKNWGGPNGGGLGGLSKNSAHFWAKKGGGGGAIFKNWGGKGIKNREFTRGQIKKKRKLSGILKQKGGGLNGKFFFYLAK